MGDAVETLASDEVAFTKGEVSATGANGSGHEEARGAALEGVYHGMTLPMVEDVRVGAPGCQRCEVVPEPARGPGTLVLRFPHTHTLGKVVSWLARSTLPHSEDEGTVKIEAPPGSLAPILSPIMALLSQPEHRGTRAMFQGNGRPAEESDYFEIEALPDFATKVSSEWLVDILREQRLYSVFQPIVPCSEDGRAGVDGDGVYGYECLMRAAAGGETVMPGPMLDMARRAGLIFQFDLAARRTAIAGAAEHRIRQKVFINFAPNGIYNPVSCLDSTVRMIDEVGVDRGRVVFEITEGERLPEGPLLKRIVDYYRDQGFGVALDDVGAGFSSLSNLLALRPDFVKLDMGLVQGVHQDPAKALVARKLVEMARELGMKTIAEGVELPEDFDWLREMGVELAQGYLFARPGTPPPHLGPEAANGHA